VVGQLRFLQDFVLQSKICIAKNNFIFIFSTECDGLNGTAISATGCQNQEKCCSGKIFSSFYIFSQILKLN